MKPFFLLVLASLLVALVLWLLPQHKKTGEALVMRTN